MDYSVVERIFREDLGAPLGGEAETVLELSYRAALTPRLAFQPDLQLIRNVGGGYTGLGSDQNYSLIAAARSRWAWLFDYVPHVVRLHRLVMEVIRPTGLYVMWVV